MNGQANSQCGLLDVGDFGVGEALELIDEVVDLSVGGFDLALEDGVGMAGFDRPKSTADWLTMGNAMSSLSRP